MKKALIDLNILLDMLSKRMDHESSLAVYDLCCRKVIRGYIASHEITALSYFLEKNKTTINRRNRIINNLLDNLSVLSPDEAMLRKALDSEIQDYEDAVIDELASREEVDFIVTRNQRDFARSRNQVYSAAEAVLMVNEERTT